MRLLLAGMLILAFLLAGVAGAASAAEPKTRNPIPDPALLLESDSFSILVVQLREDDAPIHALLKAALNSIASGEAKMPESMAGVVDYLKQNNRADMLLAGLPYQAVRVDRMLPSGQTLPLYASTLSGWRGLQVQMYHALATGPDGKAWPAEFYRKSDLIFREHSDDPTWAGILYKVQGTLLFAPTADMAKKIVDRLMPKDKDKPGTPASGALLAAWQALPKTGDAYGVVLNQKGAFSALLKAMDNEHVRKIREKVGSERLERAVASTRSVTWQADVVTEDRAEFQAILKVDAKDAADVAALFEEGKAHLDPTMVVDATVTQAGDTVTMKLAMIGLKKLLLDSLAKGPMG